MSKVTVTTKVTPSVTTKVTPSVTPKNKLFYTEMITSGVKEYGVTLLAGKWSKLRTFASAADANRCILELAHIKETSALSALEQFMRYGIIGQWRVALSSVVEQGTKIMHSTKCPDGTLSLWYAILKGDHLECISEGRWHIQDKRYLSMVMGSNTYASLNAFIRAHYAAVRPGRKGGNGWLECRAQVERGWIKMSELRYTVLAV